jgi:FtsP/CotA-like multicopper oxidase with cupredoxin domain
MHSRASKRIAQVLALLAAGCVAAGVAVAQGALPREAASSQLTAPAAPADPPIDLCATTGTVTLPGSVVVQIWGFVQKGTQADCSDVAGTATLPGPVLHVNEGDTVTLSVTNALPAGHDISVEVPGLDFLAGPTDAAVGATVSRTFTATAPGTYLYESVGDEERQTAMGLYGALIVDAGTAGQAYDTAVSAYDVQAPLVLSAIDPAFNAAANPNDFDMTKYKAQYWLINGKAYSQSDPSHSTDPIHAAPGQKLLLRYINAGFDNTTMTLLGMDEHVIARDAHLLPNAFDATSETLPAGGTEDVVATVPAAPTGMTNGFPLFNRQLHVTNGSPTDAGAPGGMLTFVAP